MEGASELYRPPVFEAGTKVRASRAVRNDGTYPGRPVGAVLIAAGAVGYVKAVGTYLNRFYVYSVDFIGHDCLVGMRGNELELLELPS